MEEDAARRDFTINGLFEDPDGEGASKVIDFHDGVADLKNIVVFGPLVILRKGLRKIGFACCGPFGLLHALGFILKPPPNRRL